MGERTDILQRLVDIYKFERVKSAHVTLGELLVGALPSLPANTVAVPIPTVRSHIRERGYDHAALLARLVARRLGLTMSQPLVRITSTTQRGASAAGRRRQASLAFGIKGSIVSGAPYLLIDDVITTGATIKYAADELIKAGASQVWAAVVAKQTLD